MLKMVFKLNKKGIEEEGTRFATSNLAKIIILLIVLALAILIIIPIISGFEGTLSDFAKRIYYSMVGG